MSSKKTDGLTPEEIRRQAEEIAEEIEETEDEQKDRKHVMGFGALALGILVVLMVVPYYSIKLDPEPDIKAINTIISQLNEINRERAAKNINRSYDREDTRRSMPYLAGKVSSTTKRTADLIVSSACRKNAGGRENRVCHAKAIYYFVRNAMQYVGDPPDEYFKSPEESLQSLTGDCDDHAILLSNLLSAVGIRTRLVMIPNHVYVEAYLQEAPAGYKNDEGWIPLDTTCNECSFGELPPSTIIKGKSQKRYIYI